MLNVIYERSFLPMIEPCQGKIFLTLLNKVFFIIIHGISFTMFDGFWSTRERTRGASSPLIR